MLYPTVPPTSTRDAIIAILGEEWPLTVKKIYNEARRRGLSVSYQAVHKTVRWLIAQGVVLRDPAGYVLDRSWVSKIRAFGERVERRYAAVSEVSAERLLAAGGQTFTLRFETVFDCYRFLLETIGEYTRRRRVSAQAAMVRHLWWLLVGTRREHRLLRDILRAAPLLFSVRHDAFGDRLLAPFYRQAGAAVRLGDACPDGYDVYATDGLVIEIYYPNEVLRGFDAAYGNQDTMLSGLTDFYGILFADNPVDVVLIRNEELAGQKLEAVRRLFGIGTRRNKKKEIYSQENISGTGGFMPAVPQGGHGPPAPDAASQPRSRLLTPDDNDARAP